MLELRNRKNGFWPLFMDKPAAVSVDLSDDISEEDTSASLAGQDVQMESVSLPVEGGADDVKVVQLSIGEIFANPDQPRKVFKDEELMELSASIQDYGVLQPVIVRPWEDGRYILIAGERRYRAARLAGLKRIPAIIRNMEEEEAALVALVENVQREDLNYIEEAKAYKRLMEDFNLTQGEIAQKVGKQQSTISNKIRILSLPEEIQVVLTEHKLTERHARALLRLSDGEDRKKVISRIVKNNLNVKQTEKLIEDVLRSKEAQISKRKKINYISYKIYVNTIRKAFGQIQEMEKGAKFSQEDKGDFLELKITIPKNDRCFT